MDDLEEEKSKVKEEAQKVESLTKENSSLRDQLDRE